MRKAVRIVTFLIIALSFVGCETSNEENVVKDVTNNKVVQEIKIPEIKEIIEYMCSKKVGERDEGSQGNKVVMNYLESILKQLELEYVFNDSYFHEFEYISNNDKVEKTNNVVGKITGKNKEKAIVITAHFDAWYNGALDNASGVGCAVEIMKNLKEYTQTNELNCDIIIVLTNLEMSRFKGSKAFVKDITSEYSEIYNINVDCVGLKGKEPMAIKNLSSIEKSQILYKSLEKIYKEKNIKYVDDFSTLKTKSAYKQKSGVSDYISFEKAGIPNMQVAQKGISDYILNENDDIENLDITKIEELSEALTELCVRFK